MAMATSNPPSLRVTKVWPLEKYARFIPEEQGQVLPQKDSSQKKAGNWKVSYFFNKGSCSDIHGQQLIEFGLHVPVMWLFYQN